MFYFGCCGEFFSPLAVTEYILRSVNKKAAPMSDMNVSNVSGMLNAYQITKLESDYILIKASIIV